MAQILELGSQFAGYRIEALIGRGGMGELYQAENPRLGNKVALKLLAPELAEEHLFRERFVRESRLAASLNHPNVIPIFDAGEEGGLLYIAMRYVDGPDLKALLQRDGALPLERVLSIVGQVGSALDCGHQRGLIHRDVKPGNILLEEGGNGAGGHVYLSDFGVAKHTLSRSGLTSTGQFVGTIDYIAPEQIEGKTLDGRADVYSLGCVLFEALTGTPPFDRESNVAMMYAHLLEPPPSLSERRPDLPGAVDEVVETALAKDPAQRYESCSLLVQSLRERSAVPAAASTVAALAPATVAAAAPPTRAAAAPAAHVPATPAAAAATPRAGAPAAPPSFSPAGPDAPAGARRRGRKRLVGLVALVVAAGVAATAAGMSIVGGGDDPGPVEDRLRDDQSSPGGEGGFSEVDPAQQRAEGKPSRGDRLRPYTGGNQRDTPVEVRGKQKTKVARGDRLNREAQPTSKADRIREPSPTPPPPPPSPDRIRTPPAPPTPPPASSDRLRGGGSSGGGSGSGGDRLRP
jgi:Protein kinase domain